jgi:hypothetical protein
LYLLSFFFFFFRYHQDGSDSPELKHRGVTVSWSEFESRFYGIDHDCLELYISCCHKCCTARPAKSTRAIHPIKSVQRNERWQCDLVDMQQYSVGEANSRMEELEKKIEGYKKEKADGAVRLITAYNEYFEIKKERDNQIESGKILFIATYE